MKSVTIKLIVLLAAIFFLVMKPTAPLEPEDDNPSYIRCTQDAQCYPYGLRDCKMVPQYVAEDLHDVFSVCVPHNMCRWDSWGESDIYDDCWDYYIKPDKYANDFAPEH